MTIAQITLAKLNDTELYAIVADLMNKARRNGNAAFDCRVQDISIHIFVDGETLLFAAFADDGDYIRTNNRGMFAAALAVALS